MVQGMSLFRCYPGISELVIHNKLTNNQKKMKKLFVLIFVILTISLHGLGQNVCPPQTTHFDFYFNTPVVVNQQVGITYGCEPDTGQTDVWSIDDPLSLFGVSNGSIIVINPSGINSLGTHIYNISVSLTDNGAPPITTTATVTLYATKPNEPPVIYAQ